MTAFLRVITLILCTLLPLSCAYFMTLNPSNPATYDLLDDIDDNANIPPIRIRLALDAGAEINKPALNEGSAIMHAAASSVQSLESVQTLVEAGGRLDLLDQKKHAPVHYAASYNSSEEVVAYVMEHTPSPSLVTEQGDTPLHFAVRSNPHKDIIFALVAATENINTQNEEGQTALHLAAERQEEVIVQYILSTGGDSNIQDRLGRTPMHIALNTLLEDNTIVARLIQSGGNVDLPDGEGNTVLHYAAQRQQNPDLLRLILLASNDPYRENNENQTFFTLLSESIPEEALETLRQLAPREAFASTSQIPYSQQSLPEDELLLQLYSLFVIGADPTVSLSRLETLIQQVDIANLSFNNIPILYHAIQTFGSRLEVIELILKEGANPLEENYLGETTIHYVAQYSNNEELLKLFLDLDVPVDARDIFFGNTALHYAARYTQNPQIYTLLVDAGASLFTENIENESPIQLFRYNPILWEKDMPWQLYEAD